MRLYRTNFRCLSQMVSTAAWEHQGEEQNGTEDEPSGLLSEFLSRYSPRLQDDIDMPSGSDHCTVLLAVDFLILVPEDFLHSVNISRPVLTVGQYSPIGV